jgi:8-oxo-dGTP diphosphatase
MKEQEKIFETFIKKHRQKFSDIEKTTDIQSNKLSYHLSKMVEQDLLIKEGDFYSLSKKAEKLIPFFAHMTGKEIGNLCVVLCAIIKDKKILLMKRKKRPYQGYWGLIGGKLQLSDSISGAALREVKEETDIDCQFTELNSVLHERVKENDEFKHAFVLFLCTLTPKGDHKKEFDTEEGLVKWFDLNSLNKDELIPSDHYMIKNLLNNKTNIKEVTIEDKEGKLTNMDIKEL